MGLYDDVVEVTRRTMTLFFVIDTSGSMEGAKIGTVNSAIEEIVPELREIAATNADAQLKVATLSFSTGAQWITTAPVAAENFVWHDLDALGVTDLGAACKELNEKLSRKVFMCDAAGSFAPVILLLSDGAPTDDYKRELNNLKANHWFKKAIKVAIAIGEDANKTVLADFTGTSESVITVHTREALKKWIKFVSVRSSEVGSRSAQVGSVNGASNEEIPEFLSKQDQFVKEIQNQAADAVDWDNYDDNIQW